MNLAGLTTVKPNAPIPCREWMKTSRVCVKQSSSANDFEKVTFEKKLALFQLQKIHLAHVMAMPRLNDR